MQNFIIEFVEDVDECALTTLFHDWPLVIISQKMFESNPPHYPLQQVTDLYADIVNIPS